MACISNLTFKHICVYILNIFLWNFPEMNVKWPHWWWNSILSSNDFELLFRLRRHHSSESGLCEGNPQVVAGFPSQSVMRKTFLCHDVSVIRLETIKMVSIYSVHTKKYTHFILCITGKILSHLPISRINKGMLIIYPWYNGFVFDFIFIHFILIKIYVYSWYLINQRLFYTRASVNSNTTVSKQYES